MYDFENMDQQLIAYVNIFICANRLQAIMDSGFEDITRKAMACNQDDRRFPRAADALDSGAH